MPNYREINRNDHSVEVTTDIKKIIKPEYDYVHTNYQGNTCITYILENYKGWDSTYFQDISDNSLFIFGHYNLILPESILKSHKNINVKFDWRNFPGKVSSNQEKAPPNKIIPLSLEDFSVVYYFQDYKFLDTNTVSKNKFIYSKGYDSLIKKVKPHWAAINTYLEKHFPFHDTHNNSFIFVENEVQMDGNGGFGIFNDQEYIQVVGINKGQTTDNKFMRMFIHEYLHKIIGKTIRFIPKNYPKEFWFKEGFVDYLSAKVLLDTKIWNTKDYVNFYNEQIFTYLFWNMDKHKLEDLYSKPMYQLSGYIAGMLYASKLDNFIITNTNHKHDLVKFLNIFSKRFIKNKKLHFSEKLFLDSIKSFVKKPFPSIEELRKNNNLLSDQLLFKQVYLKEKKMSFPVYSCDFFELMSIMKLNNKNLIAMWPTPNQSLTYSITLLDSNGKVESTTLKPSYITKSIPQYEL